jgi:Uma2 family endonuclease
MNRGTETLRDLFRYEGKAELIAGRVVQFPLMGYSPGRAAGQILFSLHRYEDTHPGEVYGPGLVCAIPELPIGRQSFCPDGSYHYGPWPEDRMSWIEGAPAFAVEMRVLKDYESRFDPVRAAKRADYFAAGTQVVWDVDPVTETVAVYRAEKPKEPSVFRRGDTADAEPAVPGWCLKVDDLFG